MWFASFIGGPLAGGYVLASNFKLFSEPGKVRVTVISTMVFTVVLFWSLFLLPEVSPVPEHLIPIIYTATFAALMKYHQGARIDAHMAVGGAARKWWHVVVVALISLAILTLSLFVFVIIPSGGWDLEARTYGAMGNEIAYEAGNLTTAEVDECAKALEIAGFFDSSQTSYIYLEKSGDTLLFSANVLDTNINDPEVVAWFSQMQDDLEAALPDRKVVINLMRDDIENVARRFE